MNILNQKNVMKVLPISVLCCVLASCSSNPELEKKQTLVKPNTLTLDKGILGKRAAEYINEDLNVTDDNTAELKQFSSTVIDSVGGLSKLEKLGKEAPIFDDEEPIEVSVDNMSLNDFIHYIFDELLSLNYVISTQAEVDDKDVSLNLSEPISKSVIYSTAEQLLSENDLAILRKNDILYIQKKDKNKRYKTNEVGIGSHETDIPDTVDKIVQIIPYTYTNSRSLSSVIQKLTNIKIQLDSNRKFAIVEGSRQEVLDVMQVVNMLDVPSSSSKEIRLIDLAYISPDSLVEKLSELLESDGYQVGDNQDVAFITMPRLGALVVYAVSIEVIQRVEHWSRTLDVAVAGNEAQFYIFRPQYNKATDIQSSLGPLISSILGTDSSEISAKGANRKGNDSENAEKPRASSSTMSVDEGQNALIFYTTADKYRKILQLLEQLDKLPGQVILDIVIAEVTLTDNVSSGIDWFYDSSGQDGVSAAVTRGLTGDFKSAGELVLAGFDGDWRVAISLLASKSDVRVLAKPFLIVKDGESATINAGDQIPTLTQTSTSDTDRVTNAVQYVSTGISVSVTPTINAKGLINLTVSMSSSSSSPTTLTPVITNRAITTNIFSSDGQTVALGGLISEKLTDNNNHTPILGDLPIIGNLFKRKQDDYSRSELIMLITTRTVKKISEIDEFRDKILETYSFPLSQ
ncbi:secretin N-terminal domain-containing protein [Thalassotalea profundi]|uniref:Type II secretion system protein GspD n=1 Tax=Thalassotalea profundi TaxID=2036687 RepID=A0ABQ3IEH0_9GAMM|nr:secretin N-terminal domain-containing protein [Thalassotalea profundi]GHE80595.1 type II secretion system protein GspD [Thalassotalea profundi]